MDELIYGYLAVGIAWTLVDFWSSGSSAAKKTALEDLEKESPFHPEMNRSIYIVGIVFCFFFNIFAWPYMAARYLRDKA